MHVPSLVAVREGYSLLNAGALGMRASVVVEHGLSCSASCEIFLDQR